MKHTPKNTQTLPLLNEVQACLNNWHQKLLHIWIQKPYGHIIGMTSLACCLYPCTYLFLGFITQDKCCLVLLGRPVCVVGLLLSLVCYVGWGAGGLDSPGFCCAFFLSQRQLVLALSGFPFFLLYPTLPNINNNFIPGSFIIFYDNGQIVFGLMFVLLLCACNNKYDVENASCVLSLKFLEKAFSFLKWSRAQWWPKCLDQVCF